MKLTARALRNRPVRMNPPCGALILLRSSSQREPGARSTGDATSDAKHAAFRSVVSVLVRFDASYFRQAGGAVSGGLVRCW
jgi:hypothetical protein